eukprot:GHVS01045776.1.p1 GENE.GHVS01045776.1~~GHVS01045776.1.p1  ORF type:complete len:331 (-),score=101.58 GHVS01045776.1:399-1391(-)
MAAAGCAKRFSQTFWRSFSRSSNNLLLSFGTSPPLLSSLLLSSGGMCRRSFGSGLVSVGAIASALSSSSNRRSTPPMTALTQIVALSRRSPILRQPSYKQKRVLAEELAVGTSFLHTDGRYYEVLSTKQQRDGRSTRSVKVEALDLRGHRTVHKRITAKTRIRVIRPDVYACTVVRVDRSKGSCVWAMPLEEEEENNRAATTTPLPTGDNDFLFVPLDMLYGAEDQLREDMRIDVYMHEKEIVRVGLSVEVLAKMRSRFKEWQKEQAEAEQKRADDGEIVEMTEPKKKEARRRMAGARRLQEDGDDFLKEEEGSNVWTLQDDGYRGEEGL